MPALLPAVEVRQGLHSVALTPILSIFLFPPLPIYTATFLRDPQAEPSHARRACSVPQYTGPLGQGTGQATTYLALPS